MNKLRFPRKIAVSSGLVGLLVIAFVMGFFAPGLKIWQDLAFESSKFGSKPWSALTWPVGLGGTLGLIGLVFGSVWILQIGAQIERDLTSLKYALFLIAFTVVGSLFMGLGGFIFAQNAPLYGAYPLIAALTVVWATRNPEAIVTLIIFPIKAKWLGWFSAAIVFFSTEPQFAPFAAAPLALAWAFAANRLPAAYGRPPASTPTKQYRKHWREDESFHDDVRRRESDRAERERLRKLFEGSLNDDSDKKG
ncbi:MAG: hypothetical protein ABL949_09240 [Fimbriimonadaceae bacterium]